MKKFILLASVAMLSITTTTKSSAGDAINCKTGQQSCGTNCCWSIEGTTLKITGGADGSVGTMKDYKFMNSPWYAERKNISSVDVSGISKIGAYGLCQLGIEQVTLPDTGITLNSEAISHNYSLKSITIPPSTVLGYNAIADNSHLREVIVAEDSKTTDWNVSAFENIPEGVKFVCQGNQTTCKNKIEAYIDRACKYSEDFCIHGAVIVSADDLHCVSKDYFWNGAECIREPDATKRKCCADVCKDMGGYCNRIRYTPAEAAEVLRNDNTNEVTITFKK